MDPEQADIEGISRDTSLHYDAYTNGSITMSPQPVAYDGQTPGQPLWNTVVNNYHTVSYEVPQDGDNQAPGLNEFSVIRIILEENGVMSNIELSMSMDEMGAFVCGRLNC